MMASSQSFCSVMKGQTWEADPMDGSERLVRWGVMGTAAIASKVGQAIQRTPGAELVAIASRSSERSTAWAAEHGVPRSYGNYQSLLEDDDLDAIYIPLPPSMHAEWTIHAAEHGKHVLCEKPLALNAQQAEEMTAACHEHNVQLMDGVMWVHHPRTIRMRQLIEDGALGSVSRLTSSFSCVLPDVPGEIRWQAELGCGVLMDLGWYCVRAAMWAFGDLPDRVYSTARYVRDVDVSLSGILWFEDNRIASFDCSFDMVWRKWFEVAGSLGTLVCDDFVSPWKPEHPRYWTHNAEGNSTEHVSDPVIQEECMIDDFCQAVRNGQQNDRWPREALGNQRVCDALAKSARSGAVVKL